MPSQYKGISKSAKGLLASGESKFVDYKEKVKGFHAEDLVAFANSNEGGAILIGVREATTSTGVQIGEPIGHPVDDDTRLQILGKALSCSPPVQIEIVVENLGSKPFYRIEIPSGSHKPYATNSGTYKIREDGRNNPLHPEQLLKMFLEREGEEFSRRFTEATSRLDERMANALSSVENLEDVISSKIEEIGSTLGWAEFKTSDAADTIETVQSQVASLVREARKQTQRLRAIVRKVDAEDPVKQEEEEDVRKKLAEKLKKNPELLRAIIKGKPSVSIEMSGTAELDEDDLKRLLAEVAKALSHEGKDGS
ncbi:MAG TPA: RNA-binding domain-containing protein [Methylocella sp.]|nr:RNA-binding domain-containing protein [Methylocella sp.]